MSITISAHELGHTLGLEHMDALGPIGFGIANPPGEHSYYPDYAGPVGAFTTQGDVIASPASVGSTLANAADGLAQFGPGTRSRWRSSPTGRRWPRTPPTHRTRHGPACQRRRSRRPRTVTDPVTLAGVGTVVAQPVSLYTLNVPNPITTGFDAGKTFDVSAVNIDGYIGGSPACDRRHGNPMIDPRHGQTVDGRACPITTRSRVRPAS